MCLFLLMRLLRWDLVMRFAKLSCFVIAETEYKKQLLVAQLHNFFNRYVGNELRTLLKLIVFAETYSLQM